WATANTLTLDAYRSISIKAKVLAEGTSGLALQTSDGGNGGQLSFGKKGHLEFRHVASTLAINGAPYRLVNTVRKLATLIATNPSGSYALATRYDASRDGVFSDAPIATTFTGK